MRDGDVVFDIGAAAGIFGLDTIERAKKFFLFECSPIWIEPLNKTFEPWEEKTLVVEKMISDHTDAALNFITVDDFVLTGEYGGNKTSIFIKADIEGAELSLLRGAQQTLENTNDVRIALTYYHNHNDARELEA